MAAGSRCSASRVAPTTSGSAISDIIAAAAMNERPKTASPSAVNERQPSHCCWKTIRPKIASTMLGVPATTSTPDSTARASHGGRPYSVSQTAVATPSGAAIASRRSRSAASAEERVQEAAALRLVELGRRALGEQAEAQVLRALDRHVDHDRAGDRDQRDAGRPSGE